MLNVVTQPRCVEQVSKTAGMAIHALGGCCLHQRSVQNSHNLIAFINHVSKTVPFCILFGTNNICICTNVLECFVNDGTLAIGFLRGNGIAWCLMQSSTKVRDEGICRRDELKMK